MYGAVWQRKLRMEQLLEYCLVDPPLPAALMASLAPWCVREKAGDSAQSDMHRSVQPQLDYICVSGVSASLMHA